MRLISLTLPMRVFGFVELFKRTKIFDRRQCRHRFAIPGQHHAHAAPFDTGHRREQLPGTFTGLNGNRDNSRRGGSFRATMETVHINASGEVRRRKGIKQPGNTAAIPPLHAHTPP
jgi:hypothetical protein